MTREGGGRGGGEEHDALVGAVLCGRYRLVRKIGEGSMGLVYAADDLERGGLVAVKMLREEFLLEPTVAERFAREADAARELRHPNIASGENVAMADSGQPFFSMPLIYGESLEARLERGRVSPAEALAIVRGVLQGLSHAHALGWVHRDLKPANILLEDTGDERAHPRVIDFGIAKVIDTAGGLGQRTRTGAILGTPRYMSPEQVMNPRAVDARSDLFSVASVFYETLTGVPAFDAPTEFERMGAILREEPRALSVYVPELLPWEPFFARALAKDPSERFANAEEMLAMLAMLSVPEPAGRESGRIARASSIRALADNRTLASEPAPPVAPRSFPEVYSIERGVPKRASRRSFRSGLILGLVIGLVIGSAIGIGVMAMLLAAA